MLHSCRITSLNSRMGPRRLRLLALLVAVLALTGCTTHYIRSSALSKLQTGEYEQAISIAEEGLKRHPDNPELMATLLRARSEAIEHFLVNASELRARHDLEGAWYALNRALHISPSDERVRRLYARLELDRNEAVLFPQIRELLAKGKVQDASRTLRSLAIEDPQNPELRGLQRQIESRLYQSITTANRLPETAPVTLQFRDAPPRQIFEALSRETRINFILDKDIRPEQRVTAFVRDASLERALDVDCRPELTRLA